jgi:CDGSH-type Zn-finger protein
VPTVPDAPGAARRRVIVETGGPIVVEGPVELVLPEGTTVCSDRFMVAVCACRRSKRYPFCDTSHRKKIRTD